MFSYTGKSLKTIATIALIVNIFTSLIGGISLTLISEGNPIFLLIVPVFGIVFSYLISAAAYGLGSLIDRSNDIIDAQYQLLAQNQTNKLFCSSEESNLVFARNDYSNDRALSIKILIDNENAIIINNNSCINLKVSEGEHAVQLIHLNGEYKNSKTSFSIKTDTKKIVNISYGNKGINVKYSTVVNKAK